MGWVSCGKRNKVWVGDAHGPTGRVAALMPIAIHDDVKREKKNNVGVVLMFL